MSKAHVSKDHDVPWPPAGVVRVHLEPGTLPHLGDEPGANRFDDPRPRTIDRFLMRYAASSLRGCLLELMAALRPSDEARHREEAIDADDPHLVEPPLVEDWQHIADFLEGRKVASLNADGLVIVSINDPAVQDDLDKEPAVRAVLDTHEARVALLERGGRRVHLENAAVRLSSSIGRYVTQACALALYDRADGPDAIHYRSRHDDAEDCWAIFDFARVEVSEATDLSPASAAHLTAVGSVAVLWNLPLPPAWQ